jgi:hypothetical protein
MDSNFRFRARDKASVPRFRFGCLRGSPQTAAAAPLVISRSEIIGQPGVGDAGLPRFGLASQFHLSAPSQYHLSVTRAPGSFDIGFHQDLADRRGSPPSSPGRGGASSPPKFHHQHGAIALDPFQHM